MQERFALSVEVNLRELLLLEGAVCTALIARSNIKVCSRVTYREVRNLSEPLFVYHYFIGEFSEYEQEESKFAFLTSENK